MSGGQRGGRSGRKPSGCGGTGGEGRPGGLRFPMAATGLPQPAPSRAGRGEPASAALRCAAAPHPAPRPSEGTGSGENAAAPPAESAGRGAAARAPRCSTRCSTRCRRPPAASRRHIYPERVGGSRGAPSPFPGPRLCPAVRFQALLEPGAPLPAPCCLLPPGFVPRGDTRPPGARPPSRSCASTALISLTLLSLTAGFSFTSVRWFPLSCQVFTSLFSPPPITHPGGFSPQREGLWARGRSSSQQPPLFILGRLWPSTEWLWRSLRVYTDAVAPSLMAMPSRRPFGHCTAQNVSISFFDRHHSCRFTSAEEAASPSRPPCAWTTVCDRRASQSPARCYLGGAGCLH